MKRNIEINKIKILKNEIKILKSEIKIKKKINQNTKIIKLIEFLKKINTTNLVFKSRFIKLV